MARGILYRIRDWADIYENAHTRKLKFMNWVPTPNKHDGEGYGRVFEEVDGCALYGAWHLILQVASKCQPRGTLCRRDGTPLDPRAIALKTRAPQNVIEHALDFFASPEVGWLEALTEPLGDFPNALGDSPTTVGLNRIEENRIEGNRISRDSCPASDEAERLASHLLTSILAWKPNYHKPSKPAFRNWVTAIDRMIRLDERTPDEIRAVITWATTDDFWQSNILSADKLRKQFDRLQGQMQRKPNDRARVDEDALVRAELARLEGGE